MTVSPPFAAKTVAELIAYAKANRLNMATAGKGSSAH
jgi:tripartite-type tricarboxylate transporter receptor subunit TctC